MRKLLFGLVALTATAGIGAADAAEYNKRPFPDPGSQAKIGSAVAKGFGLRGRGAGTGGVITDDVVNTDCGALNIAPTPPSAPGQPEAAEQNLIILGDIINAPRGCNRRR